MPSLPRPLEDVASGSPVISPFLRRIEHDQRESCRLRHRRPILGKHDEGQVLALFKLPLRNPLHLRSNFILVERRTTVVHDLLERGLEPKLVAVRSLLANIETARLHLRGSGVYGRRVEFRKRVAAGEKKAGLAREFGISRETLYAYLTV